MAVYKSRFELLLEIENRGRYPVMAVGYDISANAIPMATCSVNIGRRMTDGKVSPADTSIWSIRKKDKAKIYFHAEGDYADKNQWPNKDVVIFEGFIDGLGQRNSEAELELVVFIRHWLAYLDSASAISSMLHPGSPVELLFDAVVPTAQVTAGGLPNTMGSSAAGAHMVDEWAKVGANLWGDGLKPLFWHLMNNTSQTVTSDNLLLCIPGLAKPSANPDILDALKRLLGESTIQPDCSSKLPAYAPALNMRGKAALPEDVVRAVGLAVGNEMSSSFGEQTIWGKLLQYAGQFMFAVIPQISQALVVPFIPSIRQTYCKEISVNDYSLRQVNMQLARSLRGVAIYNTAGSTTGLTGGGGSPVIGGCYAPPVDPVNGLVWVIPPPSWLANMGVGAWSPTKTTAIKSGQINSGVTPRTINKGLQVINDEATVSSIESLMNGYAHTVYTIDSLRGRAAQISDRLRFDISPGSIVRITSTGDPFIKRSNLQDALIGCVIGVSVAINAEKTAAGVTFQVEFLRTEPENGEEQITVEKHPLYEDAFVGAPLVDELQFGACNV